MSGYEINMNLSERERSAILAQLDRFEALKMFENPLDALLGTLASDPPLSSDIFAEYLGERAVLEAGGNPHLYTALSNNLLFIYQSAFSSDSSRGRIERAVALKNWFYGSFVHVRPKPLVRRWYHTTKRRARDERLFKHQLAYYEAAEELCEALMNKILGRQFIKEAA